MRNLFRLIATGDRRRGEIHLIRWISTFSPKIPSSGSRNPTDSVTNTITGDDLGSLNPVLQDIDGVLTKSRVSARDLTGGKSPGKDAVFQICLDPVRYVMHIFHYGITPGLRELLENSVFTKVGVAIHSDACNVLRDHGVKIHDLMDLSSLANLKFGGIARSWGLRSLTEKLLSIQVLKSLPDATKGDELEKKYLKTDATKDDELEEKILKTVTTKGDELKKKILKMALMPLLACKSWMALISDTFFINSNKIKNQKIISTKSPEIITMKIVENINTGVIVYLMDGIKGRPMCYFRLYWTKIDCNLRFFHSPGDNGTIIVHCNGLFLIGKTAQRLLVCNPATREVVALPLVTYFPDTVRMLSGAGIGLDHSTNKYKVVRIFAREKGNGGIEVITVDGGKYNSWRRLKTYPPYMMTTNLTVVTVQGAAYWIINKVKTNKRVECNDRPSLGILRFDLSREKFTVIDSPDPYQAIHLAELQGHLCCYAQALDRSIIWVWLYNKSDNIATDHWVLGYTIHHLSTPTLGHHGSFKPVAIDQEGCLLFECVHHMHLYDPGTNQFCRTSVDDRDACSPVIRTWCCHTTSYAETLMPLSTTTTCD